MEIWQHGVFRQFLQAWSRDRSVKSLVTSRYELWGKLSCPASSPNHLAARKILRALRFSGVCLDEFLAAAVQQGSRLAAITDCQLSILRRGPEIWERIDLNAAKTCYARFSE